MRLIVLIASLTIAGPALAQMNVDQHQSITLPKRDTQGSRPPAPSLLFEPAATFIAACDLDGDGRTTRTELTTCVARSFAVIDTKHSGALGFITYADWATRWLGDANALPSAFTIDTDNDNRITLAELQAQFDQLFTGFDKDKDGVVMRAELLTVRSGFGGDDSGQRRGKH